MSDIIEESNSVGRNPVPMRLIEERRGMAVFLRIAGYSMQSILDEINTLETEKHWGIIGLRTLERDIADYYRKDALANPDMGSDHINRMRDSHIAQLEKIMEEVMLNIVEKTTQKSWKPYEKVSALDRLYKMRIKLAELQGWSYAKSGAATNHKVDLRVQVSELEMAKKAGDTLRGMSVDDREKLASHFRNWRSEDRDGRP